MKDHFTKQPSEIFPISVDFSRVMNPLEFVNEANSSVTAYKDATGEDVSEFVLQGDFSESAGIITQKIKGGNEGDSYTITFLCATTANNIYEKDIKMDVIEI